LQILRTTLSYSILIFSFSYCIELSEGFVYLKEVIPNIKIDLKYFTKNNFVGNKIKGYNAPVAIVTKETAYALKEIQNDLKHFDYGLKIFDCYRPQQAVNHFVRWAKNNSRKMKSIHYPDVKKKNLFKEGYIATKSSHTRGSTIDLTIINLNNGKELNMGTVYDFFGKESWQENINLTIAQRANRLLLLSVMKKYGFKPLKEEWWHYTLSNEPFPDKYFNFPVE